MFKIPNTNKQFIQSNLTDRLGNIVQTKNVTFDEPGYIKLEKRTRTLATSTTLVDLTDTYFGVKKITSFDDFVGVLGNKNLYFTSTTNFTSFTKDGWTTAQTVGSGDYNGDMVEFNNKLYFGTNTDLYKGDGATWVSVNTDNAENLCLFRNLNCLAYSTGTTITLINTSDTVTNTVTLLTDYKITSMAWNNNRLYIGTSNLETEQAALFVWDGLSASANSMDTVDAHTIYAVTPYKDGVSLVTSNGELLYFNGSLQVLDRFPVYNIPNIVWNSVYTAIDVDRKISPYAMYSNNDKIFIGLNPNFAGNIPNRNSPLFMQKFPGGVWCYDPQVGLYHRYSIDTSIKLTSNAIGTGDVNTTTDVITVGGVTVPATGTPVFYYAETSGAAGTAATPLVHGTKYYTIYVSDTTLKLATTNANAIAGTAINLTGTGNANQFLEFVKNDAFGGIYNTVSAIMPTKRVNVSVNPRSRLTDFYFGGSAYDQSAYMTVIASPVSLQENRGYFITSKFESQSIDDIFSSVHLKYKNVETVEDNIIVKYRTTENTLNDYLTYTDTTATTQWTDGNTFTTTVDISAIKTRADAGIYDEIEIVSGVGAGTLAHITSITESSGTYTVNIDETVPNVTSGDDFRVVYSNWTKLGTITSSDSNGLQLFGVGASGKWIQFKVELRGEDVAVEELAVNNKPHTQMV